MTNEVEITLKVVDEASAEIEAARKQFEEMTKAFAEANPDIVKSREEMENLITTMEKYGINADIVRANLEKATSGTEEFGGEVKKTKEEIKEAEKETEDFVNQLKQIGKGLIGVSGLFMLGRAMKSFVTDAIDAAREAGELPKVFDEAADAADRLQVAMGARMARTFAPIVETQRDINESILKQLDNEERINQALAQGLITREEANIVGVSSLQQSENVSEILEIINEREQERLELIEEITVANETLTHAERNRGEEARRAAFEDKEQREEALEAARELAALTPIDFFADVDVDIADKISAAIRDIEFVQLGFTETVQQAEDLIALLSDPTIFVSPETIQGMLADLETQAELEAIALDFQLGEIDLNEAKREIRDNLGVSFAEAEAILMNIINDLNEMDGRRIQIFIDWQGEVPGMPGGAGGGTGGGGGGDGGGGGGEPGGGGGGGEGGGGGAGGGTGGGPTFGIGTIVVQSPGDPVDMVDALVEALS